MMLKIRLKRKNVKETPRRVVFSDVVVSSSRLDRRDLILFVFFFAFFFRQTVIQTDDHTTTGTEPNLTRAFFSRQFLIKISYFLLFEQTRLLLRVAGYFIFNAHFSKICNKKISLQT